MKSSVSTLSCLHDDPTFTTLPLLLHPPALPLAPRANFTPFSVRWDPTREDDAFFEQSVVLHCAYYLLQIMIHRPSGPKKGKEALVSARLFVSLSSVYYNDPFLISPQLTH